MPYLSTVKQDLFILKIRWDWGEFQLGIVGNLSHENSYGYHSSKTNYE